MEHLGLLKQLLELRAGSEQEVGELRAEGSKPEVP